MTYAFPPSESNLEQEYAYWENGYTKQELDELVIKLDQLPSAEGVVGRGTVDKQIRNSKVAWVPFPSEDPSFEPLYRALAERSRIINDGYFQFNLWGFFDRLQYTVYEGSEQHYGFHLDNMGVGGIPRKLSFTIQLSDPFDYDGGELQLQGKKNTIAVRARGMIHFFPSTVLHRVTPITRGVRRSLVGWIVGPKFC